LRFQNLLDCAAQISAAFLYPDRIDYTGNAGASLAPYSSVRFVYNTARPDVVPAYHLGSLQRTTALLTDVQTYQGSTLVADYKLAYEQSPITTLPVLVHSTRVPIEAGTSLSPTSQRMSVMPSPLKSGRWERAPTCFVSCPATLVTMVGVKVPSCQAKVVAGRHAPPPVHSVRLVSRPRPRRCAERRRAPARRAGHPGETRRRGHRPSTPENGASYPRVEVVIERCGLVATGLPAA
jgi:hypothetical protein